MQLLYLLYGLNGYRGAKIGAQEEKKANALSDRGREENACKLVDEKVEGLAARLLFIRYSHFARKFSG